MASASYGYEARARDAAGNLSGSSNAATAVAAAAGQSVTLAPDADAHVEQANPSVNYGTATMLTTDPSLRDDSYPRFTVSGLGGTVTCAKLRLYVNNGTTDGPALYRAADGWSEGIVTWVTKPATTGAAIEDKGAVPANGWLEYDLSAARRAVPAWLSPTSLSSRARRTIPTARDLTALGVRPGAVLLVHCRLSALGTVVGGAETVVRALLDAAGPDGTLVAYIGWEDAPPDDLDSMDAADREFVLVEQPVYDPAVGRA